MFLRLEKPQFEGVVGPHAAEDWLISTIGYISIGWRSRLLYESRFTTLARYTPQLVSTLEEKCYKFLRGLIDSMCHAPI
ncbi:hypothetical protein IEQ34_007005 [Dendrobium chrysotoxum]|uniref:Uncharacterized protein n=1 Tax=Dendrobium chrysotoxum TaxID=161865 RepID=A0AAV7GRY4_DENCH|nr:hypothetical protein IEQ34_007005 [Dendrobium chrysotoxum]